MIFLYRFFSKGKEKFKYPLKFGNLPIRHINNALSVVISNLFWKKIEHLDIFLTF